MTVKEVCEKYGLRQRELACQFGIPIRSVEDWYAGRRTPPDYLVAMMEQLLEQKKGESKMKDKKMPIEVIVEDDKIAVRCCGGMWYVGETDNRWLWVLNAIAFPDEHSIKITDIRQHREDHQPDMTTKED